MSVKYDPILGETREQDTSPYDKGYYATPTALTTAIPTGEAGWFCNIGTTDTVWIWDADTSAWIDTKSKGLQLGETSSTAGRGDYTKAAHDHSQASHAPANAQKNSDITKGEIEARLTGELTSHSHAAGGTPTALATSGTVVIDGGKLYTQAPVSTTAWTIGTFADMQETIIKVTNGNGLVSFPAGWNWQNKLMPLQKAGVDYIRIRKTTYNSAEKILAWHDGTQGVDAYTKMLLHFDALPLVDSSLYSCAINNAQSAPVNTSDKVFGTASLDTNGLSYAFVWITTPADARVRTGDYCLEAWVKGTGEAGDGQSIMIGDYQGTNAPQMVTNMNYPHCAESLDGGAAVHNTTVINDGAWHHLALVRYNGVRTLYVDGVGGTSVADLKDYTAPGSYAIISRCSGTNQYKFDEFRLSVGDARYTGNFTVPTGPFGN